MNCRRQIALITLSSFLFSTAPTSLAGAKAVPKRVPSEFGQTETWPGGSVQELWHSTDELSLFVKIGAKRVEFRFRGDAFALEASVVIDGEARWLDYNALRRTTVFDDASGPGRSRPTSRTRDSRRSDNDATLQWIDRRTGGGALELSEADSLRLFDTVARVTILDGIEKGSCLHNTRAALSASGAWMFCISSVVVSAGSSLAPCFVIGAGMYFLGLSALQSCVEGGDGAGSDNGSCNCSGISPDCMCCTLDPGAVCNCHCPGEECCDWDDVIGG